MKRIRQKCVFFYLSKHNLTNGCLSSTSKTRIFIVGIEVSNMALAMYATKDVYVCLASALPCTDVWKCKYYNNNNWDNKNSCGDLVEEEEENVC